MSDSAQIDLEDAIRAHPLTVAEYAEMRGRSKQQVRLAISNGFLCADRTVRPMVIKGGEMPMTAREWQTAIAPAIERIRPGVYSFSMGSNELHLLGIDGKVHVFKIALTKAIARQQLDQINAIPCRRIEGV